MVDPAHVTECLDILHFIAGGEEKWRERPFVSQSNCFVVPPMKFAEDACRCLKWAAAGRNAGPAALGRAGRCHLPCGSSRNRSYRPWRNALQVWSTSIASSQVRCHLGPWPFVSDLRTGAMSGGSGEQALITSGCAQMGHFYNLTVALLPACAIRRCPTCRLL